MLKYTKTRLSELGDEATKARRLKILVKREDLNHDLVSGNKWWKLKYNLEEARRQGKNRLLTFGGAYSNHIYATAAAAAELGFGSIGIIRGEETLPLNSTLEFARSKGMRLHYLSREAYKRKSDPDFVDQLKSQFGDFYLIPEGGTNALAVKGCAEFGQQLFREVEFDYLCLPVGTGGTMAGLINGLNGKKQIIGFPSLKDGMFLEMGIQRWLTPPSSSLGNWSLESAYHFGGYAKMNEELSSFIRLMKLRYALPLDPVYTSKMIFGVLDLIAKNYFRENSKILILHTGGLEAVSNFE